MIILFLLSIKVHKIPTLRHTQMKINENIQLILGDCLEEMKHIPDGSVDLILSDLPYCETGNKWDKGFKLKEVLYEFERIIKNEGAIVLTGSFKFGIKIYSILPHLYKYDWIWVKDNGTNAPNVNYQPFRNHEMIFVLGKGRVTNGTKIAMKYFPQKTNGKPYKQKSGKQSENWKGGLKNIITHNLDGNRHPKTVQFFKRDKEKLHPTAKPTALFEFLIKSYTEEGNLVIDATAGSMTTAIAAINTKRKCICIEKDEKYFEIGKNRVINHLLQSRTQNYGNPSSTKIL